MKTFEEVRKQYVIDLLEYCKYNIYESVKLSGISRASIYRLAKSYNIKTEEMRNAISKGQKQQGNI